MERIVYENPPVQEAMLEIGIVPSAWDPRALGRYFDRVSPILDGEPLVENLVASVQTAPGESTNVPVSRIRFQSIDQTRVLQIQPASVSVHRVGKYEGWDEEFRPFAAGLLTDYVEESPGDKIARLAVRFINSFRLPIGEEIKFNEYFTSLPPVPSGLDLSIAGVLQQSRLVHNGEEAEIDINFGVSASIEEADTVNIVLDIGARHFFAGESVSLDEALVKADRLHVVIRSCFESYITETMRGRLGRKDGK